MKFADFAVLANQCRELGGGFSAFLGSELVHRLGWPHDVLEQWLYDHSNHSPFLQDYGSVDLSQIGWRLEVIQSTEIAAMSSGLSESEVIDEFASNPDHWIGVRKAGIHVGVAEMWEIHGTWKRWPILIERKLLDPEHAGLQVVEGRTRVGVLKGRMRQRDFVAERHLAWVGRQTTLSESV